MGVTGGGVQPPSTEVVLASPQLSVGLDRISRSEGGTRADARTDREFLTLRDIAQVGTSDHEPDVGICRSNA